MNRAPTVEQTTRRIIRELRAMRNPARARSTQQYFKHEIVALGIDTATARRYGLEQIQRLKPAWSVNQALRLCDRLLREPELEIRGMGFLVLGGFDAQFTRRLLTPATRWLRTRLDNWALVDGFCLTVLSPLLQREPAMVSTLRRWSAEEGLWVRRAALVTLVPFARRGQFLDLAYELAGDHFPDPEDLMHKAMGWLLREAGRTDPARLKGFLLQHGPRIPRTAVRYAIERFPADQRARLLQLTRARPGMNRRKSNTST